MKLGVNGWRLRTRTGIARVLYNVLRHWTPETVNGRFNRITLYTPMALDADLRLPGWIERRVLKPDLPMLAWENLILANRSDDDVLFSPSYTRPILTKAKTVTIIHEANSKLFPQHFRDPWGHFIHTPLHGWSARNSTLVVTSTPQSREDVIRAYGPTPEAVRVVPLAAGAIFTADHAPDRLVEIRRKYAGGKPYFLFVGKLTPRRNASRLVEAFAGFRKTGRPERLVIVGLNSSGIDVDRLAQKLGVGAEVTYCGFAPDEDLAPLYSGAEAFVLPSSYEAVSLTVLEAQAAGTPVITADTNGLREMSGGAAFLLPDVRISTLISAMHKLVTDPDLRKELVERGSQNAARYSWRGCAEGYLDVLYEAAMTNRQ